MGENLRSMLNHASSSSNNTYFYNDVSIIEDDPTSPEKVRAVLDTYSQTGNKPRSKLRSAMKSKLSPTKKRPNNHITIEEGANAG